MAITTYAELKTAVARWIGESDAASAGSLGLSSSMDDLVMIAEQRILTEVRTKDNEASINTAIASGVVAVPSDYIALKFAYLDGTPVQTLERRTPQWLYANFGTRSSVGKPKYIARDGTNFVFGPYPDSGYTMIGTYYAKLTAIATTVNAVFLANPDLYLFGCLAESVILVGRDSRIPIWEQKYRSTLAAVNGLDAFEGASGSDLQMRVG